MAVSPSVLPAAQSLLREQHPVGDDGDIQKEPQEAGAKRPAPGCSLASRGHTAGGAGWLPARPPSVRRAHGCSPRGLLGRGPLLPDVLIF